MMGMRGAFLVACCGLLFAAGCAKQEVVKKDEGIAPAVKPVAAAPVQKQVQEAAKPAAQAVEEKQAAPVAAVETDAQRAARERAELQQGLQKIFFSFDSAKLSDEARATLTKNADLLKKATTAKIRVEGNCDERGSDDYNLALGEKRAKEAAQYLANLGIPQQRLATISYGKEKPVATGHDEVSWSKNRRDEFVVIP